MLETIRDYSSEGLVQAIQQYAPNMHARLSYLVHEQFNNALRQEMSLVGTPIRGRLRVSLHGANIKQGRVHLHQGTIR